MERPMAPRRPGAARELEELAPAARRSWDLVGAARVVSPREEGPVPPPPAARQGKEAAGAPPAEAAPRGSAVADADPAAPAADPRASPVKPMTNASSSSVVADSASTPEATSFIVALATTRARDPIRIAPPEPAAHPRAAALPVAAANCAAPTNVAPPANSAAS